MTMQSFEAPTGTLSIRKTRDYVDSYADLDKWDDVGSYTVISCRTVPGPEDGDGSLLPGFAVTLVVEPEEGKTEDEIKSAIEDSFTSRGCAHEHDCCGCVSSGVDEVRRDRSNFWTFAISRSRNI